MLTHMPIQRTHPRTPRLGFAADEVRGPVSTCDSALRDMALVLHLTCKVKQSLLQEKGPAMTMR